MAVSEIVQLYLFNFRMVYGLVSSSKKIEFESATRQWKQRGDRKHFQKYLVIKEHQPRYPYISVQIFNSDILYF